MQRSPIRTLSILALASLATATSASAQCAYLWPNRENSLINGNDKAAAVVSFYEGGITEYVYVAGTRATVNGSEIVLYKYDRHCGQLQPGFPVTYSGPAGGTNEAVDLIVEGQQGLGTPPTAVYVIGASQGVGTGLDFVTLKFNADGTPHSGWGQVPGQPWAPAAGVRRYNNSLVNGNDHPVAAYFRHTDDGIYVLGTSDGGSGPGGTGNDYALVKYGPNGQRSWVGSTSPHIGNDGEHRSNSAGTNNDRAADISGGKIAVSGGGIGAGHSVVFITGTAPATALGRSDDDYATLAIRGNDGYRMWSGDSDGVVYFDGGQQPTPLNDQAVAMAAVYSSVDPAIPTTVVVTGNSAVPPSEAFDMMEPGGPAPGQCNDIVTVAYDTTVGLPAWNQPHRYDDLGSCDAAASVVTAYEASNIDYVWITGTSEGDIVAIKLDRSTGIQSATWPATATEPAGVRRYDGGGADTAVDIVASDPLNGGGNIYVAGSSVRLGSLDYATIHWDKDGIMPMGWPKFDAGPAGGADVPEDLVIGKYDVFVTGTSAGVGAQNDLLTQRH